jgi:hypothetical protein
LITTATTGAADAAALGMDANDDVDDNDDLLSNVAAISDK